MVPLRCSRTVMLVTPLAMLAATALAQGSIPVHRYFGGQPGIPDGHYLVSAGRGAAAQGIGGLFVVHPLRLAQALVPVQGLPAALTGAGATAFPIGADCVTRVDASRWLVGVAVPAGGQPVELFELSLTTASSVTWAAVVRRVALGTSVANTWAEVSQIAPLGGTLFLCALSGFAPGGATAGASLCIVDLGVHPPALLPLMNAPTTGFANAVAVEVASGTAFLAMTDATCGSTTLWEVPLGGGAAISMGSVPGCVTGLRFAPACGPGCPATVEAYGGSSPSCNVHPFTKMGTTWTAGTCRSIGGVNLNTVALEPATGALVGCSTGPGQGTASVPSTVFAARAAGTQWLASFPATVPATLTGIAVEPDPERYSAGSAGQVVRWRDGGSGLPFAGNAAFVLPLVGSANNASTGVLISLSPAHFVVPGLGLDVLVDLGAPFVGSFVANATGGAIAFPIPNAVAPRVRVYLQAWQWTGVNTLVVTDGLELSIL